MFREDKPGINNLISIYCAVTGKTIAETEKEFEGKGYGDFKLAVGEAVAEHLKPIQEKYEYYLSNKDYLKEIYTKSEQTASFIASKTMFKVYKKLGLTV